MADRQTRASAIVETALLPPVPERTVTAADIEAKGGLTVNETGQLMEALGFAAPEANRPAFTPEEAEALIEMAHAADYFPLELRIRSARRYGRHLAQIASGDVQQFHDFIEPLFGADGRDGLEGIEQAQAALNRLTDIGLPWLVGVYRRWVEHEFGQAVVGSIETEVGGESLPGAVEVTIGFCDLKDFTAFADRQGDAAAVEAIDGLIEVVTRERGDQLRMMKSLGDGVLLCYSETAAAVNAMARMVAAMAEREGPGVHASVHRGIAITRDGDYFGSVVNVASRLLAAAGHDELVATAAVVEEAGDEFTWEPAGRVRVRGVSEPIEILRLVSPAAG